MMDWIELLFKKLSTQVDANKNWFDDLSPVFVYGTGTFAKDVFSALTQKGIHVSGFLDHREVSPSFVNGLPVMNPASAFGAVVVLGIHNREADVFAITRRLDACGVKQVVSPVELFDQFAQNLEDRYWLTGRKFYHGCKTFILKGFQLLKDPSSRELYSAIIEFRLTGNYAVLPEPDIENQYFSKDVPTWKTPLRFVDCGAFDGDTLLSFIDASMKFDAVAAFEPDQLNFSKLSRLVLEHSDDFPDAILYPCGVFRSTSLLTFAAGYGEASAISANVGGPTVQCVALDDVIPTFAPTLIKMDIEGAECDALLGARRIINQYLPGLAISIYHRPEHLWQIPLLVEDLAPQKYDFYIRSHARNTFDTVLYCVPSSS